MRGSRVFSNPVTYGELDVQFNKWSWELYEALECELIKCGNKINSSKQDHNIENAKNDCIHYSFKELDGKYMIILKDLVTFLKKHDHATILSKYYFATKQKLEELKKDSHYEIKNYCTTLLLQIRNNRIKEEMLWKYQENIRGEITELVANSGPNLNNEELQSLFEESWKKWLEHIRGEVLPIAFPDDKQICNNIENSVMKVFLNEKGLLISQLNSSSMEERSSFEQNPFEVVTVHINPFGNEPALVQSLAYSETSRLIGKVTSSMQQKLPKLNAYNSALIEGDLNSLSFSINEFNSTSKKFKFTSQYKVDIALYICIYAARQIKTWVKRLKQQNDVLLSLQKQREKFFKIFENKYLNIATEKAAANQLCNSLTDVIAVAVCKKMPLKIASHLRETNKNFKSKHGLKLQVLKDLAHEENFELYRNYIIDSKSSLKKWVMLYTEKHCTSSSNLCDGPIFIELANDEVVQVVSLVQNVIGVLGLHSTSRWLERFCCRLSGTVTVQKREWRKELKDIEGIPERMKSFITYLGEELSALKRSDKITCKVYLNFIDLTKDASNKLYENIMKVTCKAQCPFCKEECDNPGITHTLHSVRLHRPQCIGRTTWLKDKKLVIDVCNSLVASENDIVISVNNIEERRMAFKDYKKFYPGWDIPGRAIAHPPTYWMWVIVRFYKEILAWTNGNETDIPDVWKRVTKEEAIRSLVHPNNK